MRPVSLDDGRVMHVPDVPEQIEGARDEWRRFLILPRRLGHVLAVTAQDTAGEK